MAGDLVLITGATGHLGFQVLKQALEQGYQIRAAVRSASKAKVVKDAVKDLNRDSQLDFVVVPDFLVPGAFDSAVQGVKYIIHVASPITSGIADTADHEELLIKPAVYGTLGVFESAAKSPSVKRIVITSSIVAIASVNEIFIEGTKGATITAESRTADVPGPYPGTMAAYAASKVAALNAAEKWIKENKPKFDVIHIHPSFIFGRDDLTTTVEGFTSGGTNGIPLTIALGKPAIEAGGYLITTVWDTARIHVDALNPSIPGNQSFISSNDGSGKWSDINDMVARHFPDQVKTGVFPNNAAPADRAVKVDVAKTEQTFGYKTSARLEEAVVSAIKHFLELTGQ
ncbi:Hypothetical protein R9X50_00337700 [Acrodontium crateriforme]|uniref:NAD-dependent epimerase/dehydratase domain-containing protein n=1 Tax=Acrodontium crateriforme TaxID=150365 RepID=A0AAQ3M5M0_9PEZI|nr:Hypothetical protein R9X50_00337700 [Acrodontium crateriforme]